MDADRIVGAVHRAVDRASYGANFVLAALMILLAASHTYNVAAGASEPHIASFIGYAITIACGAAIIADRNRSLPRSVGLYAIGLGCYRFFTSIPHLVPHSTFNLLFYAVMIVGLNMALSGRAYLLGKSRARSTMMMGSIVLLLMCLIFLIYIYSDTKDALYVLESQINTVLLALMYFTLILILDSEKLRRLDWIEVHGRAIGDIRRSCSLDRDASMALADAEALTGREWPVVDDGGPVESELRVRILNGSGTSDMIFQKWRGSEDVFLTMTDDGSGTILRTTRLTIVGMRLEKDRLMMETSGGDSVSVNVEVPDALQER